jgi:hypothetical protein
MHPKHPSVWIPYELDQHAFVMVGQKTLFLWHLTMLWMEMHEYEVVLRASVTPEARETWEKDARVHSAQTYFLGNLKDDPMAIPDLATGARRSFRASIWAGIPFEHRYPHWPWDGIEPLVADTPVTVERVVAFRHFDLQQNYPESLTYLLFGADKEAHLGHCQTREPDFDEVITLEEAPSWLPPQLLEAGVHVNFPDLPATPVHCCPPLLDEEYMVRYCGQNPKQSTSHHHTAASSAGGAGLYPLKIGRSLWFSTKVTNVKDPCQKNAKHVV